MAVDKNNNNPIYSIKTVEDINQVPDEHMRELAGDIFRLYLQLTEPLSLFGMERADMEFQPNGLGDANIIIIS